MILCTLIGLGMVLVSSGVGALRINRTVFLISLLSGAANSAFVVFWLISVKRGAYMMLDVFCMLGILIPLIGCSLCFGEEIRINHIIGIVILLAAVCIMCSYNNSIKSKMTVSSFILLLVCGAANGFSDFSQKLFVKLSDNTSIAVFNLYTYLVSAVILIIFFLVFSGRAENKAPSAIKPIFGYILIMSVCLFLYSYFKTLAAQHLSSAQLYPLAQSGSLILSTVMSAVLFHERLNIKCIVGISMSFAALIVINVL